MDRLMRFLGLARTGNDTIVDGLFEAIVAAARRPALYARFGAPDTPLGRFEMLALHMALVLRAARGSDGVRKQLAQDLTDEFFKDVDHSLRELGIGDGGVPKRMKTLASMFYGRLDSYARAIDDGDAVALAAALERNVAPGAGLADAPGLAAAMMAAAAAVDASMADGFVEGRLSFGDIDAGASVAGGRP